ncbi:hypothetical protein KR059_009839 [Drosophila kikkawai]|nr:hypothetical protein KR059_009839 [Drosophila kikkawai]
MHRSVLLLLMSALLLSAAVALPLSLEESAETSWLDLLLEDTWESEEQLELLDTSSHENAIHKRAAKDSSSSSEEHKDKDKDKDKANSSGASSSEEQKTTTDHAAEESTTQAAARRRRQTITKFSIKNLPVCFDEDFEIPGADPSYLEEYKRIMCSQREVNEQDQPLVQKASGELELDAQAEKELDEEMARAMADVKDNGSIEDYAQGCEVMEVSSKEANEATYAE